MMGMVVCSDTNLIQTSSSTNHSGGTVAKFAGQNVHKRLVQEETYKQGQYEAAMKRAFLRTDEDLLASALLI